jgi:hypothetical protein
MKLDFAGRVVACYVPETITARRIPVTVVLSGSVWPRSSQDTNGVDPASVSQVNGWRVTYWLSADDIEGTTLMIQASIKARSQMQACITHQLVTRQRTNPKDETKKYSVTEWVDSIDYID